MRFRLFFEQDVDGDHLYDGHDFDDAYDAINHCIDGFCVPEVVVCYEIQGGKFSLSDVTRSFIEELRGAAPSLFDYDEAYDWRQE